MYRIKFTKFQASTSLKYSIFCLWWWFLFVFFLIFLALGGGGMAISHNLQWNWFCFSLVPKHVITNLLCFIKFKVFLMLTLCFVARAREDTEKIDRDMKKRAEHLHHIATVCMAKFFNIGSLGDEDTNLLLPMWLIFQWSLYPLADIDRQSPI